MPKRFKRKRFTRKRGSRMLKKRRFPGKRTFKKKSTKRTTIPSLARRALWNSWGLPRVNLGTCIPTKALVKMPYLESDTLAASGAAYVDYTFSLTSIFDPNVTGTGHQPRFHDQWAVLYNFYRVRNVSVEIQANNTLADSATGAIQIIGTCISDFSAGATTIEQILESPYVNGFLHNKWKAINHNAVSLVYNKYQRRAKFNLDTIKQTWFNNDSNEGNYTAFGASPATENVYFNIYTGNSLGDITVNVGVDFIIKITYMVELYDPIFQSAS